MAAALAALAGFAAVPAMAEMRGPDTIPEVVNRVIDSVVVISTSETLPGVDRVPPPDLGPDSDLDQFFKKFFDEERRGERGQRPTGEGSGFVVDAKGIIVTNAHVIEDADKIEVTFNDGTKLPATVVGRDKATDIAVLKVTPKAPLKPVRFGDSDKLQLGQWVVAMGNPFGIGLSASAGIVSGRNRNIRNGPYDDFIQTDAAINKGNSGGPLFDLDGQVIGMDTAILSPTGSSVGIGFALPSAEITPVVAEIERYGEMRRGYIGVRVEDVPAEIATRFAIAGGKGALVSNVIDGSPAAQAGIKIGDVITAFDGKPVADARALQRLVGSAGIDRTVKIALIRDRNPMELDVRLARQTASAKQPPATAPAPGIGAPPPAAFATLGVELAALDAKLRQRFDIVPSVEAGVVVLAVAPTSPLKPLGIAVGDTIVEVEQQRVTTPDALQRRLAALKRAGQAKALTLVASHDGNMRFVRIPVG
jgi:serine protease Do